VRSRTGETTELVTGPPRELKTNALDEPMSSA
jgi:hypothetical protein